jgi:chemotaxis protein MotA
MLAILGGIIVFVSTLGGFMLAGGKPLVLLHLSEFVVIFGVAGGVLIIASPAHLLTVIVAKIKSVLSGKSLHKSDYVQLLQMMYEVTLFARKQGVLQLEDHLLKPYESPLFARHPEFLARPDAVKFLCDGMIPMTDGAAKPPQIAAMMTAQIETRETEAEHPVHLLNLVGDSLPGIGIVAAVLGIINTMSSIADGPQAVGEHVAAALTGTLLGIWAAYGFVNPLANRIKFNDAGEMQYLLCIRNVIVAYANGSAPKSSVEIAWRSLDSVVKPSKEELDELLKAQPAAV